MGTKDNGALLYDRYETLRRCMELGSPRRLEQLFVRINHEVGCIPPAGEMWVVFHIDYVTSNPNQAELAYHHHLFVEGVDHGPLHSARLAEVAPGEYLMVASHPKRRAMPSGVVRLYGWSLTQPPPYAATVPAVQQEEQANATRVRLPPAVQALAMVKTSSHHDETSPAQRTHCDATGGTQVQVATVAGPSPTDAPLLVPVSHSALVEAMQACCMPLAQRVAEHVASSTKPFGHGAPPQLPTQEQVLLSDPFFDPEI